MLSKLNSKKLTWKWFRINLDFRLIDICVENIHLNLISRIFLYRLISLIISSGCAWGTVHYYCFDLQVHKQFNCLLPESYWYVHRVSEQADEQIWKTTKCYVKSIVFWEFLSFLLFCFYALCKLIILKTDENFSNRFSNRSSSEEPDHVAKRLQNDC